MIRQLPLDQVLGNEHLHALTANGMMARWFEYLETRRKGSSALVFVAEVEGEIVGWVMAYKHFDTPADVYNLGVFVRWDHRCKGIGRALVQAVVDLVPDSKFRYSSLHGIDATRMFAHFENDPRFHRNPY